MNVSLICGDINPKDLHQSLHMITTDIGDSVPPCGGSTDSAVMEEFLGMAFHFVDYCVLYGYFE